MKKINNRGFVLAETLIISVFLMVIFGMIYSNFYPLIGEYEKRETYDDVDGKYSIYWIKKLIEDGSYTPSSAKKANLTKYSYMRFECKDVETTDQKRETCKDLVKELEVAGCDKSGNNCDIFITPYTITDFKNTIKQRFTRLEEDCMATINNKTTCKNNYISSCVTADLSGLTTAKKQEKCADKGEKTVINSGMEDYIDTLPDYTGISLNHASYRVIASFRHKKDYNNYYSYATIEVNR